MDDEDLIRWSLRQHFEKLGCTVVEASTGGEAREMFREGVDLVLLDHELPDTDGLTLLAELRAVDADVPVVLLTAFSSVRRAVDAMRKGAFHFISKPFDVEEVAAVAEKALETTALRREVRRLRRTQHDAGSIEMIIGQSEPMRRVKALLLKLARTSESTVLLTGESGTGKELAARAIHLSSARADGPFTNITRSALPAALLESELFGHERGAFTDAKQKKKGLLEQAAGGTVFLDEIGEMTPALQAKLLRFLEEHDFRRVGGSVDIHPDVCVIAATNRDLPAMVQDGTFREDLYYRLTVLQVDLPPLRERCDDIPLLVQRFIERFNRDFRKSVRGVSATALRELSDYPWPGNIRELRNVIERAMLLTDSELLEPDDFQLVRPGAAVLQPAPFQLPPAGVDLARLERDLVVQALERTRGNQTRAARLLGMNRDQIRYRVQKYGLRKG